MQDYENQGWEGEGSVEREEEAYEEAEGKRKEEGQMKLAEGEKVKKEDEGA